MTYFLHILILLRASERTLNSLAQVVSPPLLVDDRLVDLAGGQVVVPRQPNVEETLVVS